MFNSLWHCVWFLSQKCLKKDSLFSFLRDRQIPQDLGAALSVMVPPPQTNNCCQPVSFPVPVSFGREKEKEGYLSLRVKSRPFRVIITYKSLTFPKVYFHPHTHTQIFVKLLCFCRNGFLLIKEKKNEVIFAYSQKAQASGLHTYVNIFASLLAILCIYQPTSLNQKEKWGVPQRKKWSSDVYIYVSCINFLL